MGSLPLVLKTLLEEVNLLYQKPPLQWLSDRPTLEDMVTLRKEALQPSQFDPLGLKRSQWQLLEENKAHIVCKSCAYAKVLMIQPKGSRIEPPWDLWARLFQWLGPSHTDKPWRVFWLPAPLKRQLPAAGEEVGSPHLNGGYAYPCHSDVIVVYRLEEATRVLTHELLHAACLDPPNDILPLREATTETWAELFLVALCSKGKEAEAVRLWKIQSQWIADQNATMERRFRVKTPQEYAWRYTVGRALILETLNIPLPLPQATHSKSSRLTSPFVCP